MYFIGKVRKMSLSTLTSKGQITIPKNVREYLSLKKGDKILFKIQKNGLVSIGKPVQSILKLKGMLKHLKKDQPLSPKEIQRGIESAVAEKVTSYDRH